MDAYHQLGVVLPTKPSNYKSVITLHREEQLQTHSEGTGKLQEQVAPILIVPYYELSCVIQIHR